MNSQSHFINHYAVLGFHQIVGIEEIKKAYRILAKRYHPDVNHIKEAQEKMKAINAAYEILSSSQLKAFYDEQYRQYFYGKQWEYELPKFRKEPIPQDPPKYDNFSGVFAWLIIMFIFRVIAAADKPSYSNNSSYSYTSREMKEADSIFRLQHPNTLVNRAWVKADSLATVSFLQREKEKMK